MTTLAQTLIEASGIDADGRPTGDRFTDLPEIVDGFDFEAHRIETPPELVTGLLHQGDKLAIGGGSKSFKTFALLDLALSVAYGKPWLGMVTERGNVCYLNFELRDWSIQKRLLAIESAKGIEREKGRFDIWHLRGYSTSYVELTRN
jgi:regulatory protein RepA